MLAQLWGRNGLGADKQVSVSAIRKEPMKRSVGGAATRATHSGAKSRRFWRRGSEMVVRNL